MLNGAFADYTITLNGDGSRTIVDNRGSSPDGTDTLFDVERARFSDQTITFGPVNQAPTDITITGAFRPGVLAAYNGMGAGTAVAFLTAVDAGDPGPWSFAVTGAASAFFGTSGNALITNAGASGLVPDALSVDVRVTDSGGLSFTKSFAFQIGSNLIGTDLADVLQGTDAAETLGGKGDNDQINGGGGPDTLYGDAGNDRLNGGSGADTMYGGTGDDIYVVDWSWDRVIELANEGIDEVRLSGFGQYELPDYVENGTLLAGVVGGITGNALDNVLTGHGGGGWLVGGDGNDRIFTGGGTGTGGTVVSPGLGADIAYGETGSDTISYADMPFGGLGVFVELGARFAIDSGGSTDFIFGFEHAELTIGDDRFYGDGQNNDVWLLGGGDIAFGGAGIDRLFLASGNMIVDLAAFSATDGISTSYVYEFETIIFDQFGNDRFFGDNAANTVFLQNGADVRLWPRRR